MFKGKKDFVDNQRGSSTGLMCRVELTGLVDPVNGLNGVSTILLFTCMYFWILMNDSCFFFPLFCGEVFPDN